MRKSVFVHVPKTAGSSLRSLFVRAFGKEAVSPGFNASRLTEEEAERLDRFVLISGHISMDDVAKYFPDRLVFTVLREPLDRCVSWYYFARAVKPGGKETDVLAAQSLEIGAFFDQDAAIYKNIVNRQVRQLAGHVLDRELDYERALERAKDVLTRAAWTGRQESIGEDLKRLASVYPEIGELPLETINVTGSRSKIEDLPEDIIQKIKRHNKYDLELYDFASNVLGPGCNK